MDKIVNLCKSRGYIYPGSEIYGGLANSWDYGPLGVEFKNNVKKAWMKKFIQENKYNVGLDAAILMNPETWVASGHVGGFSDPLIDCKECKTRHRADKLIEDWLKENNKEEVVDGWSDEKMVDFIHDNNIKCPDCGASNFTPIRKFNLMFKTFQGVTEDTKSELYLRPETAQGIFVNFKNVLRTTRRKLPMGIGQVGKSLRKEITPEDLNQLAKSIVDTLLSEYYIHCCVGIGSAVSSIKDLAFSFKEAQIAIEVGKVFDTEKSIVSYDNLGIARLVYQLPTTLCEMFLKEIFKNGSIDSLDQETLFTIQRFFENNLNVSETSRKLFVHRNTLVYRLEKIKKLTGLDLREFEDAIVFKVALMVKKYLSSNPSKY